MWQAVLLLPLPLILWFRVRADKMNLRFIEGMESLQIVQEYLELYKDVLRHLRRDLYADKSATRHTLVATIDRFIERIVHAKDLLLRGDIDEYDFVLIKQNCEQRIHTVGLNLQQSDWIERKKQESMNTMMQKLATIGETFKHFSLPTKRQILDVLLLKHALLSPELNLSAIINPDIAALFGFSVTNQNKPVTTVNYKVLGN